MARPIEHGLSNTPTYTSWRSMLARCQDPEHDSYPYYGAKGIRVCARWLTFANFAADMGKRPSLAHTLDRKDSTGNYEPANCRWATKAAQATNRTDNRHVVYRGKRMTITEAWRASGMLVSRSTFFTRINQFNWPLAAALETPAVMGRNQWE